MSEFASFTKDLLITILSPSENSIVKDAISQLLHKLNNDTVLCSLKDYLLYTQVNEFDMIFSHLKLPDDSSYLFTREKSSNILLSYIQHLKSEVLSKLNFEENVRIPAVNAYYNPSLYDNFLEILLQDFLSVTDILDEMNKINYLVPAAQKIRDVLYQLKESKQKRKKNLSIIEVDHNSLKDEENWKNRNTKLKNMVENNDSKNDYSLKPDERTPELGHFSDQNREDFNVPKPQKQSIN